jgi:hypothetical protein
MYGFQSRKGVEFVSIVGVLRRVEFVNIVAILRRGDVILESPKIKTKGHSRTLNGGVEAKDLGV